MLAFLGVDFFLWCRGLARANRNAFSVCARARRTQWLLVYSLWESDNHMEGILAVLSSFLGAWYCFCEFSGARNDDIGKVEDG